MTKTKTTTSPAGLSGKARAAFLALTTEEQETYRYHFITCGRPSWLCMNIATGKTEF